MATMNSGLGGPAGYGENVFSTATKFAGDNDGGTVEIDVTAVFGLDGIDFFGTTHTEIYINSNGAITFGSSDTSANLNGPDDFSVPTLLPFYSDINIGNGGEIYWDVDPANGQITITWDAVAPASGPGANSFQVVLSDLGAGALGVEYIYGDIQWGQSGSDPAYAGVTDGAGTDYTLENSGNSAAMQGYESNDFDGGDPAGTWTFSTNNGIPDVLTVRGTTGDDVMGFGFTDSAGNQITTGDDLIDGGDGNDDIEADEGDDVIFGGAGADSIDGWTGDDTIEGGAGNDDISGQGDNDLILGGDGDDWLSGGDGWDTIFGGAGNDELSAGSTDDSLDGGDGNDTLRGESGWNTLVGGAGDDEIISGGHDDLVNGGADADTISFQFGPGNDTIAGGEGGNDSDLIDLDGVAGPVTVAYDGDEFGTITDGSNTIIFSEIERFILTDQADTLDGTADDAGLAVDASAGNDTVTGGRGADSILGGSGDDSISGAEGDDTLEGGVGDDILTGGDGDDIFSYAVGDGADTITDFNTGNSGTLRDGDATNNDFIDLGAFYDNMDELRADFADDNVLNQSNTTTLDGAAVDYTDNAQFGSDDSLTFQGVDQSGFTADNTGVVCFSAGTRILTPRGEIPVERLRVGDLVTTADNGPQPLLWSAMRHLGPEELAATPQNKPVEIAAGAFGNDRPLIVSPQHGVLLTLDGEQLLARAVHLARLDGHAVRQRRDCRTVTYWHLFFERHEIVFSNGLATESYYPGPHAIANLAPSARSNLALLLPQIWVIDDLAKARKTYGESTRTYSRTRMLPDDVRAFAPVM